MVKETYQWSSSGSHPIDAVGLGPGSTVAVAVAMVTALTAVPGAGPSQCLE